MSQSCRAVTKNFLIGMKVGSKTKLNTDIIYYNVHVEMEPPSTGSNPAQGKLNCDRANEKGP